MQCQEIEWREHRNDAAAKRLPKSLSCNKHQLSMNATISSPLAVFHLKKGDLKGGREPYRT